MYRVIRPRCEYSAISIPLELFQVFLILLSLRLTGDEGGEEDDYMGLDLEAEFLKLDDPLEFEILSHDVI